MHQFGHAFQVLYAGISGFSNEMSLVPEDDGAGNSSEMDEPDGNLFHTDSSYMSTRPLGYIS